MKKEKCVFCYFARRNVKYLLECRFNAPYKIYGAGTGYDDVIFPIVLETDWCGKFKWMDNIDKEN
jgi:hypothetical protein